MSTSRFKAPISHTHMHAQLGPPLSNWSVSYNSATSAFHFLQMRNGISAFPPLLTMTPSKRDTNAAVGLLKMIQMFPNHSDSPCTTIDRYNPSISKAVCQKISNLVFHLHKQICILPHWISLQTVSCHKAANPLFLKPYSSVHLLRRIWHEQGGKSVTTSLFINCKEKERSVSLNMETAVLVRYGWVKFPQLDSREQHAIK